MAGTARRVTGKGPPRKRAPRKKVVEKLPAGEPAVDRRDGVLAEACGSGDHRKALEALRDSLARSMEAADSNVVAQIAGRLQAVLKELHSLPAPEKVSASDELANRRAARRAATARRASAGGEGR